MRRMHPNTAWKEEQKARAHLIQIAKTHRKSCKYGLVPHLKDLQHTYRHNHIAYCEARGRKREEIEKPAENNKPDEEFLKKLQRVYHWRMTDYERSMRDT